MLTHLRPALIVFVLLTLITGILYPLAITGIAQVVFPWQAGGSLIYDKDEHLIGSELIGQTFDDPRYFWSRPSAAAYNGAASTGSNLGPTNPALLDAVRARVLALRAAERSAGTPAFPIPDPAAPVPVDLVTASASGLDPHISVAAAKYQMARIARVRNIDEWRLERLVDRCSEDRALGMLGEPRVNVLKLNMALDAIRR